MISLNSNHSSSLMKVVLLFKHPERISSVSSGSFIQVSVLSPEHTASGAWTDVLNTDVYLAFL